MRAQRLQIFGRCPEPGRVKTRLIPGLGAAGAAQLYARLLEHTLTVAHGYLPRHCELWLDGEAGADAPCWSQVPAASRLPHRLQRGADLGARMHHALADGLAAGVPTVLIGSDCPEIDEAALAAAFAGLAAHDAVFAPSEDGGYALIGLRPGRAPVGTLFEGIPWSTAAVMEETRGRLRNLGWNWLELATVRDVDRPTDILYFQRDKNYYSYIFEDLTSHALA
jgi:rSAM/selenodomain-associated transferase 1